MKLLILTNGYPDNDGSLSRMFVHVRSQYYKNAGLDVDVLNFLAKKNYQIDGISVISLSSYKSGKYDIAICHSCNLRNHYIFLKKYEKDFKQIFFFFHGFEVMRLNKDYPKPYDYINRSKIKEIGIDCYDNLKLMLWRRYYKTLIGKASYIFVSNYLYRKFVQNVRLEIPQGKQYIINNGVGDYFIRNSYDRISEKKYDFITIRSDLDGSKYAVDIIFEDARLNPDCSFLVIGKGDFFKYNKKSDNITYIEGTLPHDKIVEYLNMCRCALMPTRWDTQGVMSCEMVTYGIPLITSDIPICREIFEGCRNVRLIPNEPCSGLGILIKEIEDRYCDLKEEKWNTNETVQKEYVLLSNL